MVTHFAGLSSRALDDQLIEVRLIRLRSCIGRIELVQTGTALGPVVAREVAVDAGNSDPYLPM